MAVFDVQSIVDAFLATAVDIARDSGCAAVAIPTDAGMHLLSNQPEVERDLHKRYIADVCIGGAQPAIDGDEFWMKPVRRMDVQFDAYHRGANAVSTIYLIWRRAVCEK